MKFSFKKMVLKGVKYVVLFGLPVLVDQLIVAYPDIAQLSVGSLLVMAANWLKVKTQYFGLIRK